MKTTPRLSLIIRVAVLILWAGLFGLLLKRDYFVRALDLRESQVIKRSREESFAGVYFKDQRIGFVKNRLTPTSDNTYELFQEAYLRLNILKQSHPVRLRIKAEMANDRLRDFTFSLSSPFYTMEAHGVVEQNTIKLSLFTGKERIEEVIRLKEAPFLATNQRAYLLKSGLAIGDKIKVPYFDPISLSAKDTIMEYRGLEKILLQSRIYNLHHSIETFSGIRINSWLNG
ncbi:MAG: hypothetical protein A2511_14180 [Deltaproteobacteria bacterium RIFOXYD12_FULL_50_9]|nr:MAG: hypothetical protein A2511_14180 [Deltaproteobacteria bacterium RIFOXYD12_FULL_50_9]